MVAAELLQSDADQPTPTHSTMKIFLLQLHLWRQNTTCKCRSAGIFLLILDGANAKPSSLPFQIWHCLCRPRPRVSCVQGNPSCSSQHARRRLAVTRGRDRRQSAASARRQAHFYPHRRPHLTHTGCVEEARHYRRRFQARSELRFRRRCHVASHWHHRCRRCHRWPRRHKHNHRREERADGTVPPAAHRRCRTHHSQSKRAKFAVAPARLNSCLCFRVAGRFKTWTSFPFCVPCASTAPLSAA